MKIVGIIVEYNPFHNGHLYHIEQIKKLYPDSLIVACMSGNFTQRGEVSIMSKWDKCECALYHGVDLVVELPFFYATQSADTFAKASIEILNALHVDTIVFGSECNNIKLLETCAKVQLDHKKYDSLIQEYMDSGMNYPTALSKALFSITGKKISEPNDILALSYIREIIRQEADIQYVSIKRGNNFNSKELNDGLTSSTSIRYALSRGDDVSSYVSPFVLDKLKHPYLEEKLYPLLQYKILTEKDLSIYQTVDEGIENRLLKYISSSKTLDEFILKVKNKRYTYSKLMRMLTHILTSFTKEEASMVEDVPYIRILGFNFKGKEYLNKIKNDTDIPIISRFASIDNIVSRLEYRSTCVFAYLSEDASKTIEEEYKNTPIMY